MAIVKCRECGNSVSSEAKTCPSCGIKAPSKTEEKGGCLSAFFGLLVISYFLYSCSSSEESNDYSRNIDQQIGEFVNSSTRNLYLARVEDYVSKMNDPNLSMVVIEDMKEKDKQALNEMATVISEPCSKAKDTNDIDNFAFYLCKNVIPTYETTLGGLNTGMESTYKFETKQITNNILDFDEAVTRAYFPANRFEKITTEPFGSY